MSTKILISGARGTLGTATRDALKKRGIAYEVTVSDASRTIQGETNRILDFHDPKTFGPALEGIDKLFLLQPLGSTMAEQLNGLIEVAKAKGVKYILRSSGGGAETGSDYELMQAHGEADQVLKNSDLNYTIVRPTNFMQNFVNYYADMIRGGALYFAQGTGTIAHVDARDIGEAYATILDKSEEFYGKTLNFNGPDFIQAADLAKTLSEALNKDVKYVAIGEADLVQNLTSMGMDEVYVRYMASLNRFTRDHQNPRYANDLEGVLGKELRSVEAFIRENKESWQ